MNRVAQCTIRSCRQVSGFTSIAIDNIGLRTYLRQIPNLQLVTFKIFL